MKQFLTTRFAQIRLLLIVILCFSMGALWLIGQAWQPLGLVRTHTSETGYTRTGNWLWASIDGDDFTTEDGLEHVNQVDFSGYIWFEETGEQVWQITHTGNLTIRLDDRVIFTDDTANELTHEQITFTVDDAWVAIEIQAQVDINTARTIYPYRTEMGIYEQSAFGRWSLIPSYRLYPEIPEQHIVEQGRNLAFITAVALAVMVSTISSLIALWIYQKRLWQSQMTWLVLAMIILSLIVRFIVMAERFANDPFFHFLVPAGDDNYVLMGQQLLSGQYQLAGTFWPPAPIVWFASIVALLGPQIWKIYIGNILLSGLAAGAITVGAWQAFDNKRVAWLSGLIYALYPPLIFYQVTTQSVVLDAALIAFALLFAICAMKHDSYPYAALFGIMISLGGMSRGIALLLGLAFFLSVIIKKPLTGIKLTTVAAIFSVFTLLPQSILNASATDDWSLVPYSNGQLTLYSGNNRDADGIWTGRGAAWEIEHITEQDWLGALHNDFSRDPLRMIELNLRKVGMFWNNHEYVSNVHYQQQGVEASRLIAALSQNHTVGMALLSFFVWMGMIILLIQYQRESCFIFWSINFLIFGTILFVLAGRLRVPVMPFLVISAAVGISGLWDSILGRKLKRPVAIGLIVAIISAIVFPWMDANLPRKSYVSLPETAVNTQANFNNEIALLGFDPIETNYRENGYIYLSLYWQMLNPQDDYRVFVELADENGRIVGVDRLLGSITYPPISTSDMPTGSIIEEGYLIYLPDEMPSIVHVNVGLYIDDNPLALVAANGDITDNTLLTLFDLGITDSETISEDSRPPLYTVGGNLEILSQDVTINENEVTISMDWQATEQLYENVIIFTQVVNADNQTVGQIDSPFIADNRTTSALIPNQVIQMQRTLTLPEDLPNGTYRVIAGAYRLPTIERLTVLDANAISVTDNIILLSEIDLNR